ncbi:Gfo/Idh/MocA family protein [Clostridium thermarum]|uniref:Gfo/Idh/MocA family protein n=1 Tax=Clostridium thermarum TaxID=1716543 RepID=UPI00111F9BC9|nr:Gfo/Idh/MocA family oxidoreductase [Clostridium thermarum]
MSSKVQERKIRWGIIAPGNISIAFAEGMKAVTNAEIVAVASRDLSRAEEFAKKFNIRKAYGSYEEIVKDDEVDAIYIATPHSFHKDMSIMCLQHGKAVLCEKPATLNSKELKEVIDTAEKHNTFYMEAMWMRFLPVIREVKKLVDEGTIGELRLVKADFSFMAPMNPESRLFSKRLAGGALLDVGVYTIAFAEHILEKYPTVITSFAEIGKTEVDEQAAAILGYEDGKMAILNFAVRTDTDKCAYVYGTEGYIKIPNFWMARKAYLIKNGAETVIECDFTGNGYNYETEEVNSCIREGKLQSDIMTWKFSLQVMNIMDTLRNQWNMKYPTEL